MSKGNIIRTIAEVIVTGGLIGLVIHKEIRRRKAQQMAHESIGGGSSGEERVVHHPPGTGM